MTSSATLPALDPAFAAALRNGTLTERQAEQFARQDAAAVAFQLVELSAWIKSARRPAHALRSDSALRQAGRPVVLDALPNSTFGHRTTVMSGWFHYDLGLTISRILSVFNARLHFELTDGGLTEI